MAEPDVGGMEQFLAEPSPRGEVAHQHEERHDNQRVRTDTLEGTLLQRRECGRPPGDSRRAAHADDRHRRCNRQADQNQRYQRDESQGCNQQFVHRWGYW